MRGRRRVKRLTIQPDEQYRSVIVARFINKIMLRGQKLTARQAVYRALSHAEQELKQPALQILEQALKNAAPLVEVKSKRVGGATYQVPVEVRSDRKQALAIRWIVDAARTTKGQPIEIKLARELTSAFKNEGSAIKKRDDVHRMAEANKAFAHYARF